MSAPIPDTIVVRDSVIALLVPEYQRLLETGERQYHDPYWQNFAATTARICSPHWSKPTATPLTDVRAFVRDMMFQHRIALKTVRITRRDMKHLAASGEFFAQLPLVTPPGYDPRQLLLTEPALVEAVSALLELEVVITNEARR
jgi:hypothetical protein